MFSMRMKGIGKLFCCNNIRFGYFDNIKNERKYMYTYVFISRDDKTIIAYTILGRDIESVEYFFEFSWS